MRSEFAEFIFSKMIPICLFKSTNPSLLRTESSYSTWEIIVTNNLAPTDTKSHPTITLYIPTITVMLSESRNHQLTSLPYVFLSWTVRGKCHRTYMLFFFNTCCKVNEDNNFQYTAVSYLQFPVQNIADLS